jgi:hypothetical protein
MDDFLLRLTLNDVEYGTGELTVSAQANNFSGQSSAYFHLEEIVQFASALNAYPLPREGFPHLAGGYWKRKGHETEHHSAIIVHSIGQEQNSLLYELEQEHVSITVYPVGFVGRIGIQVKLLLPFDERNRPEDRFAVQLEIGTTYQQLGEFSKDLIHLASGEFHETVLLI